MQVLHEPVAVREESCFMRQTAVTEEVSLGRQNRAETLKSEDLPEMSTEGLRGFGRYKSTIIVLLFGMPGPR